MRIFVHDYAGHPFQVQLSRALAARGHTVRHAWCASLPNTAQGTLHRLPADLFILPTRLEEAQPQTLLEAMNAGAPIITTRQGGIPDVVREGNEALFVPTGASQAIAEAVKALQPWETWLAFSQHARHQFIRHYSPAVVMQQWEALLSSA